MANLPLLINDTDTNGTGGGPAVVLGTAPGPVVQRAFRMENVLISNADYYMGALGAKQVPDAELRKSMLGTPVLADLTLRKAAYIDSDNQVVYSPQIILETVLITVSQQKNIVKTAIQGRDGTIKEYIGMGDYSINIKGVLTSPNGTYPKTQLDNLKKVLTTPASLEVVSWWLQTFDINLLTIESFNIDQVEGGYSSQPFSINAISDAEITIRVS
jgi:hypothetical protein